MCRVNGVWACSCVRCCRLGVASGSAGQSWVIGLGALFKVQKLYLGARSVRREMLFVVSRRLQPVAHAARTSVQPVRTQAIRKQRFARRQQQRCRVCVAVSCSPSNRPRPASDEGEELSAPNDEADAALLELLRGSSEARAELHRVFGADGSEHKLEGLFRALDTESTGAVRYTSSPLLVSAQPLSQRTPHRSPAAVWS
jgi:hypothetical protein